MTATLNVGMELTALIALAALLAFADTDSSWSLKQQGIYALISMNVANTIYVLKLHLVKIPMGATSVLAMLDIKASCVPTSMNVRLALINVMKMRSVRT